ncbi:hypothetical protein L6452_22855 [Arctium lappa]|uniref:Uncharacterized protein n=1 Tax=Arctium lappa TaxID=4217 RepID=A0ACB9B040_ARCLA|nr:hypothetical protein L6452_22855 [Arctium lappa]
MTEIETCDGDGEPNREMEIEAGEMIGFLPADDLKCRRLHGPVVPSTGGVKIPVNVGVDGMVAGRGKLGSDGNIPVDEVKGGNDGSGSEVAGVVGKAGTPGKPGMVKRRRPMVVSRLPEKMRAAKREKMMRVVVAIWTVSCFAMRS